MKLKWANYAQNNETWELTFGVFHAGKQPAVVVPAADKPGQSAITMSIPSTSAHTRQPSKQPSKQSFTEQLHIETN
jgi:hypothetical protein